MPRAAKETPLPFDKRLVLNQYLLSRFCAESFDALVADLKDAALEERDEENVTALARALAAKCAKWSGATPPGPAADRLLAYDANIVRHTLAISERRGAPIKWKYFQYLALLFTEMYLDAYFADAAALLAHLNAHVAAFNAGVGPKSAITPFASGDLRKLAFWMATGSGKTLLLHVNIRQYRDYLERHGRAGELNRTILLTPNEGLSRQHRDEMRLSGIDAEMFEKDAPTLFSGHLVEILEVTRLDDASGDRTVAVDAFETNNLVLVDEGHRGAAGDAWKPRRDKLCRDGFSFEYSATFGQAVRAAGAKQATLTDEYAKCILVDYSYRYFYHDGYGKDYRIVNLPDDREEDRQPYLVGALLAFSQQQRYYANHETALRAFGIERPLWVFVGSSVTKGAGASADDKSDTQRILAFLARFLARREESIATLGMFLSGTTPFHDGAKDVFAGKYPYLHTLHMDAAACYDAIRDTFFGAAGGTRMHLRAITNAPGEIEVRAGDNAPFGVINIGAAAEFLKLYEDAPDDTIVVDTPRIGGSLFGALADADSRINVLIGARKFSEGWNSYRVSSMGLMRVGKSEGTQIIQLFGRGVRLHGYNESLKRSARDPDAPPPPDQMPIAETLNVFGVRANYMDEFRAYLEAEGLPTNDDEREIVVPVRQRLPEGRALRLPRIAGGLDFRMDGPAYDLGPPPADFVTRPIPLDWYARVETAASGAEERPTASDHAASLGALQLAFLDADALYFAMVAEKRDRKRHNMRVTRDGLLAILADRRWYSLKAPPETLAPGGDMRAKRAVWQEIATALLRKYADRYDKMKREEWEATRRVYRPLAADDANFIPAYTFTVRESQREIIAKLEATIAKVDEGTFTCETFNDLELFDCTRHLYYPLVALGNRDVKVSPVALNEGERSFLHDLTAFCDSRVDRFAGKEIYLLRNLTRGKGVGFFEAGNFYPDFILWLLDGARQYVTFVDPKGIVHMTPDDPKIEFYQTVKRVEAQLGDADVILNSFIASATPYDDLTGWKMAKDELARRHVFFQEDKATYVGEIFDSILSAQ